MLWGRAEPAVHWRGDYDRALREARQEQKKLLVLLVRPGSRAAGELIRRIQAERELSEQISAKAVSVIVTVSPRARYPIELYYTTHYPALFWVKSATETFLDPPCTGKGCIESLKRWFGE